jgi:hypothetical protein
MITIVALAAPAVILGCNEGNVDRAHKRLAPVDFEQPGWLENSRMAIVGVDFGRFWSILGTESTNSSTKQRTETSFDLKSVVRPHPT